ncbi:hypothetical protein GAYE_PCTG52G1280 [Galdieria yellowstonensis]|uniref:ZC3H15/TMA46 family C-terminal domain-containing protein n=1 Tax=Galdieria yellowstonensis TaxID=3028027 RepID=A0AAV9I809_9RHOD|nr:hypothetical protein GAYE_PCTG52G1280 [Galdieria yellowstonensis]
MPPKKQEATKKGKTVEKEKQKIVEDKTFGLKNKNKSKKVQNYVQQVKKQAAQKVEGNKPRRKEEEEQKKMSKKALLEARAAELGLIMKPVKEKDKTEEASEEEKRRQEEELERQRIANLPIEEQIEEHRKKLDTSKKVTEEIFRKWLQKRAEQLGEKKKKTSFTKGGKAAPLTGRELFTKQKELFVDDEDADTVKYERQLVYEDSDEEENGYATEGEKNDKEEEQRQTEEKDEIQQLTDNLNTQLI